MGGSELFPACIRIAASESLQLLPEHILIRTSFKKTAIPVRGIDPVLQFFPLLRAELVSQVPEDQVRHPLHLDILL